jgi:ceramide glucosyltransferase
MPFGLLGLFTGILANMPAVGLGIFAFAVLNRMILAVVAGWGVVGDRRSLRQCWLYPMRDLMGFCFWAASFIGRTIVWRGERYRLEAEGKMFRIPAGTRRASRAVAIDDAA